MIIAYSESGNIYDREEAINTLSERGDEGVILSFICVLDDERSVSGALSEALGYRGEMAIPITILYLKDNKCRFIFDQL